MSETGLVEFFLIMGSSPKSIINKFVEVSGKPQLPQYFALGYHQSRWNYKTGEEVVEVSKQFNEVNIPLDVVWLDIDVVHTLIISIAHLQQGVLQLGPAQFL